VEGSDRGRVPVGLVVGDDPMLAAHGLHVRSGHARLLQRRLGHEITGTGYTANGVTLASKTSTYDTATDQVRLDAADASWTTSTLSATDAVLWVNTAGASSTDPILGNVDFGATVTTTAGTFTITWDATGIFVFDLT
jgi:hypothetical protein